MSKIKPLSKAQKKLAEENKELSDKEILEMTKEQPIVINLEREWDEQDDADCASLRESAHWATLLRIRDRMKQEALQEAMDANTEQFEYLKAVIRSFESYTKFIEQHARLASPE